MKINEIVKEYDFKKYDFKKILEALPKEFKDAIKNIDEEAKDIFPEYKELLESRSEIRDMNGNVHDYQWDEDRFGYFVTTNGKEVPNGFFKAKSMFDRSDAQNQAQQMTFNLRSEATMAKQAKDKHFFQYEKPLSDLEKEWVELNNRFMKLNKQELDRWTSLGKAVVRRSLINGSHPAAKKTK